MKQFVDTSNPQVAEAYKLIANTNTSFFLTGRAGSGKTTFLKAVRENVDKRFVVLAPTGIAAYNAGGQTIHSFFMFGLGVHRPGYFGGAYGDKVELIKQIETIIIDEVSMVRCDLLDAVDCALRHHRGCSRPFGGVQMIFVGDIFQLPPVVMKEDEGPIEEIYGSKTGWFFNAKCLRNMQLPKIEFTRIYRQEDPKFISLLEAIRTARIDNQNLWELNQRVENNPSEDCQSITLTATNGLADRINKDRINALMGEEKVYLANCEGDISLLKGCAEQELALKVGAHVMFLRNDSLGRWVNGTLGVVSALNDCSVIVQVNGFSYEVCPVEWEAMEHIYDKDTKSISSKIIAYMSQIPLKLAWAITIHKSQGLTFDKARIDFGRGAFADGQVYVALSRVRSLEGVSLCRPLYRNSISTSGDVLRFAAGYNDREMISSESIIGERLFCHERDRDTDGAAVEMMTLCQEALLEGNFEMAYRAFSEALSRTIDDGCLFGHGWEWAETSDVRKAVFSAAGLLYNGKAEQVVKLLEPLFEIISTSLDALYILARAYEQLLDWVGVEKCYIAMWSIAGESNNNGVNPSSHRKFWYRLAILNEKQYGDPGLIYLLREVLDYNYETYIPYHKALRSILLTRSEQVKSVINCNENSLMALALDKSICEEEFLENLFLAEGLHYSSDLVYESEESEENGELSSTERAGWWKDYWSSLRGLYSYLIKHDGNIP